MYTEYLQQVLQYICVVLTKPCIISEIYISMKFNVLRHINMGPAAQKRTRVEGVIVKHAPIKLVGKSSQDCFYVSSKMAFVSALKKVTKLLKPSRKQPKRPYIRMMGMGKCVDKTISLGLRFQKEGYKVEIFTGQTTLFDEIKVAQDKASSEEKMEVDGDEESDSDDEEIVKQQRVISTIEVRVYQRDQ